MLWNGNTAGKVPWLYGDIAAVDKGKEAGEDRIRAEHCINRTRMKVLV